MKVTFILADYWGARCDVINAGFCSAVKKRSVTIDLTQDQIALLGISKVGHTGSSPQYEEIESVFVENEEADRVERLG